jgi:hypothetical protein
VKGVEVNGGAIVDAGGASGGLTQNGALVSPAARLSASAPAAGGDCRRRAGSTFRMKLSLYSAFSSGLLLLLCNRLLMPLASAPLIMHDDEH